MHRTGNIERRYRVCLLLPSGYLGKDTLEFLLNMKIFLSEVIKIFRNQ